MENSIDNKPDRSAKLETRCSSELLKKYKRIAAIKEVDLSDVLRDALNKYAREFDKAIAA